MTKTTTRIAFAVASLSLVGLVACGDDSGSNAGALTAQEQEYADAMKASFLAEADTPITDEQGECLANGMVKAIGVDGFEKVGVTPDDIAGDGNISLTDLPKEKADKLVALFFGGDCFSFGELMAEAIAQDPSVSIPTEKAKCIGDKMAESEGFKEAFVAGFTGDDTADAFSNIGDIFQIFADCDVDLADLGG